MNPKSMREACRASWGPRKVQAPALHGGWMHWEDLGSRDLQCCSLILGEPKGNFPDTQGPVSCGIIGNQQREGREGLGLLQMWEEPGAESPLSVPKAQLSPNPAQLQAGLSQVQELPRAGTAAAPQNPPSALPD